MAGLWQGGHSTERQVRLRAELTIGSEKEDEDTMWHRYVDTVKKAWAQERKGGSASLAAYRSIAYTREFITSCLASRCIPLLAIAVWWCMEDLFGCQVSCKGCQFASPVEACLCAESNTSTTIGQTAAPVHAGVLLQRRAKSVTSHSGSHLTSPRNPCSHTLPPTTSEIFNTPEEVKN